MNNNVIKLSGFLLVLLAANIFTIHCTNDEYGVDIKRNNQNKMKLAHQYYSPLTFSMYNDIINNKQIFSRFSIGYIKQYNHDQIGNPQRVENIMIKPKDAKVNITFDSIIDYNVTFTKRYDDMPREPDNYKETKKEFSKDDVEIILTYLKNNSDYFFDNKEFQGVKFPYDITNDPYLFFRRSCQNIFILHFYEPTQIDKSRGRYAWVICKCQEEPDTIFQGLIDIFEKDFISKFEE